jgi:hypothetical protein
MSDAPAPGAPRRVSNPALSRKAVSAARTAPLPQAPSGPLSRRLKSGAEDTALNVVSILRELWDDFRSSDRFFKYKAFILAGWLALSGVSVVVACPGGTGGPKNALGAQLVKTSVGDLVIVNNSGKAWTDVVVVVNGQYRLAVGRVVADASDKYLPLEAQKLLGDNGKPAPSSLPMHRIHVTAKEGEAELSADGPAP